MDVYVTSVYDSDSDISEIKVFESKDDAENYLYDKYVEKYKTAKADDRLCPGEVLYSKKEFLGTPDTTRLNPRGYLAYDWIQLVDSHVTFTLVQEEIQRTNTVDRSI